MNLLSKSLISTKASGTPMLMHAATTTFFRMSASAESAGHTFHRTSGRTSTMKMREFVRTTQRRMRTQFTSCKSRPSALTSPARHDTSLASLASCFSSVEGIRQQRGRCGQGGWQRWRTLLSLLISTKLMNRTFQSRPPMTKSLPLLSLEMCDSKREPQGRRDVLVVPEAERAIHHVSDLDRLQYIWYQSRAVQRCQPPEGPCLRHDTIFRCIAIATT